MTTTKVSPYRYIYQENEIDVKPSLHQDVKQGLHPENENDWKYTSNLDRKPTSNKEYSLNNTHKRDKNNGSEQQKTLIFKDASIRKGFAQVPNVVLRDSKLSASAKVLYALLLSYAWQDNECFPGQDTLAENMGLTVRSITTLLHQLRAKKLIGWKRQGLGKVNIYHIRRLLDAYPMMVD